MEQTKFGIPTTGWSYCPRCDKETMIAVIDGQEFECPFCGLGFTITQQGGTLILVATQPVNILEIARYQLYCKHLTSQLHQARQVPVKPPKRVRLMFWLAKRLGLEISSIKEQKKKKGNYEHR